MRGLVRNIILSLALITCVGHAFANSVVLRAQNIGFGLKQIDADKTYSGLVNGDTYEVSFDVLFVNKPIFILDGSTFYVITSTGPQTINFTASSATHTINFSHLSFGFPARIEMDNFVLTKSESVTSMVCTELSDADYRYGFQGQEKDDEIKNGKGNSYAFDRRIHDPRIGRFLTIDPLTSKYASYSPYIFSGNRVIDSYDLDGAQPLQDEDGKINDNFKAAYVMNLPDGTTATIYSVHGGSYAVTPDDRNKINAFRDQGFYATPRNRFDQQYVFDNGTDLQILAGVGGVSQYTGPDNPNFVDDLFRNTLITAPSEITPQQQLQTGITGRNINNNGNAVPLNNITNAQLVAQGTIMGNRANTAINNLVAGAPVGSVVDNFSVDISLNQNFTPAQQTAFRNSVLATVNPGITVNFVLFDPADTGQIGSTISSSSLNQANATQTGPAVQTLQEVE